MSIANTIIGLGILLLFVVPVILISRSAKNKKSRLLNDLMSEASKNGLFIAESDSWDDSVIGLDTKNKKIVYIDENDSEKKVNIFSFSDLKSFKTVPNLTSKGQKLNFENVNNLSLIFGFKDPSKSELNLNFYMAGFGKMTKAEKELFEKWSALISKYY